MRGTNSVYSGSSAAKRGAKASMPVFTFRASLVITAPPFISAPVPEAVTTAPRGRAPAGRRRVANSISHRSCSVLAWAATILQQSITDPPPTARIKLTPSRLASAAPCCTLAYVGLGIIPENSTTVLPSARKYPMISS